MKQKHDTDTRKRFRCMIERNANTTRCQGSHALSFRRFIRFLVSSTIASVAFVPSIATADSDNEPITVFLAQKVVTMDPTNPRHFGRN